MADGNGPRWVRVALIVVALTSAACGGSDGDDSFEASVTTSAAVAATTTVAPPTTDAPETTTTTVDSPTSDPALWLADLNRARRVMSEGLLVQFERLGNPASEGWGTIAFEIEHLEVGIDLVSAFLPALDDPPAALADRAAAWVDVAMDEIDRDRTLIAGFEGLGVGPETALADLPVGALDAMYADVDFAADASRRLAACFDVSEAASSAGFGVLDCTNSEAGAETIAHAPTGPGPVPPGEWQLPEPGLYGFDTVSRPFALEIDEPTDVIVGDREVEVFVEANGHAPFFHVVAVDEIVDPAVLPGNVAGDVSFDQMVPADDLGSWFEALPFAYETGVSVVGEIEAPYWRLEDVEPADGDLSMHFWAESSINGVHMIVPGSVFWEVPHPDGGSLIVYANRVVEAPDDVPGTERVAIGEAFLASLRFG